MSRYVVFAAVLTLMTATSGVRAQNAAPRSGAPATAEKAPAKPAPVEAPAPAGQPVNIKLDLTITDQAGSGEASKKAVSMLVADRAGGSIRSIANSVRATLNVDATPQVLPNGLIRVQLALEYNPQRGEGPPTGSSLNQRVAIVLVPGKSQVLSQAADPLSDRKITVEVRAEIMK
jgi:hypothetical protein